MTRSEERRSAPFYDLFKLIVAVILTLILLFLLLGNGRKLAAQVLATPIRLLATLTETPAPPTATGTVVIPTATVEPQPTAVLSVQAPPTTPSPTPVPSPTPTETIPSSDPGACPSAPSRIHVGDRVRVLSWLHLRQNPGLGSPILLTNSAGTVMEVLGGPVCTSRSTESGPGAYLWWYVRMENSNEGWSAEAPLIEEKYFLEPIR